MCILKPRARVYVCVRACVCFTLEPSVLPTAMYFTKDSEEETEGRSEPKVHKAHHHNDLEEHIITDTVEHSKEKSGEGIQENSETGKKTPNFSLRFLAMTQTSIGEFGW